jgi:YidC/Oxa1 family membrane protein insertase
MSIWHTFFFDPIYNLLVFFIGLVRDGDVGLALIATLVVVRVVLLPFSIKAAKTQRIMREIEPKLKEIKENNKDDKQAQATQMMALYKEAKLNPFASILLIFLQLPIVIALYLAFSGGGGVPLPDINTELLYSFVEKPEAVTMIFLGLIDTTGRSILLALGAGATQYVLTMLTLPKLEPRAKDAAPNFKEDFTRNLHVQMKYVMPLFIVFIAYSLSTAIALYFLVSNLVLIAQEFYIKKHR